MVKPYMIELLKSKVQFQEKCSTCLFFQETIFQGGDLIFKKGKKDPATICMDSWWETTALLPLFYFG